MQRAPPSIVRYTFLCLFLVATIHSALRAEKHQLTSQPRALRYRSFLIRFQLFHFFRVAICVGNCESHPNISVVHGVSACGLNQIPLISPTSRVFFLSASITCVLDCETAQTVHLFPYSRFASGIVNLPKHFICSWCPFCVGNCGIIQTFVFVHSITSYKCRSRDFELAENFVFVLSKKL